MGEKSGSSAPDAVQDHEPATFTSIIQGHLYGAFGREAPQFDGNRYIDIFYGGARV